MSEGLRIGLLIESSRGFGRGLLRGIAAYGRTWGPWTFFYDERAIGAPFPESLKQWCPDGIIVRLNGAELVRQVRDLHVPTVDLYHEEDRTDIPTVMAHHEEVSRMVVEHFVDRGFTNFAFCGLPGALYSQLRAAAFVRCLAERGHKASAFDWPNVRRKLRLATAEARVLRQSKELGDWLRDLRKPVALMACNDLRAHQVLTVCTDLGIAVPEEIAVVGVDNDQIVCELCDPPLSSVDPDAQRIGYEAAALLHRMIRGEPPTARLLVPPARLVPRRSSDILAIADREVAEAVRYLRKHACEGIEIEAVLSRVNLSRSTLERWFRTWLGRSPSAEITRIRVEHMKELLATTALSLDEIARLSGFGHVETMCRVAKRALGETPGEYRHRSHYAHSLAQRDAALR